MMAMRTLATPGFWPAHGAGSLCGRRGLSPSRDFKGRDGALQGGGGDWRHVCSAGVIYLVGALFGPYAVLFVNTHIPKRSCFLKFAIDSGFCWRMSRERIQTMRFLNRETDDQIANITLNAGPEKNLRFSMKDGRNYKYVCPRGEKIS
jgi:hypothetical protein